MKRIPLHPLPLKCDKVAGTRDINHDERMPINEKRNTSNYTSSKVSFNKKIGQ